MKIALKRDFVLSLLKEDINDPQEFFHLNKMTDVQLYEYFVGAEYLENPDECIGIVKAIPEDCIDGKIIFDDIGLPLNLEYYLEEPKA